MSLCYGNSTSDENPHADKIAALLGIE